MDERRRLDVATKGEDRSTPPRVGSWPRDQHRPPWTTGVSAGHRRRGLRGRSRHGGSRGTVPPRTRKVSPLNGQLSVARYATKRATLAGSRGRIARLPPTD